ncbi:hypothetical protein Z950_554 [Sulfitobacter mediterraneus KCTC 32188]|nr:hypothetical protein Z950_554 [Sulfitobacter mediterraneus KCTC 32188]
MKPRYRFTVHVGTAEPANPTPIEKHGFSSAAESFNLS